MEPRDVKLDIEVLRSSVQLACQPSYVPSIQRGRAEVLALPRAWVLEHVEEVALTTLDLSDYWEYRRFLELAELLDADLLQRFVVRGLGHADLDVREAAEDYQRK